MKVDISGIGDYISCELDKLKEDIADAFIKAGEESIRAQTERRTSGPKEGTYQSQSGNLASSTGYAVIVDGEIVMGGGFEPKGGKITGSTGGEGSMTGKSYISELARGASSDFELILAAGMNYAEDVQNEKGRDVLITAELKGERILPKLLKQL